MISSRWRINMFDEAFLLVSLNSLDSNWPIETLYQKHSFSIENLSYISQRTHIICLNDFTRVVQTWVTHFRLHWFKNVGRSHLPQNHIPIPVFKSRFKKVSFRRQFRDPSWVGPWRTSSPLVSGSDHDPFWRWCRWTWDWHSPKRHEKSAWEETYAE